MIFTFRVKGVMTSQTYRRSLAFPFDETYEVEGEHPAEALEKLVHEIEWTILDSDRDFTIAFEAS